jgi:hypothetical protein
LDILSEESKLALEISFIVEEIKQAIMDSNGKKSPRPDDLSFHFYQYYWNTIKDDIISIINAFNNHSINLSKLNLITIILFPKISDSTTIQHYRSISLINYSLQIISKILSIPNSIYTGQKHL